MPIPAAAITRPSGGGIPGALLGDRQVQIGGVTLGAVDSFGVEFHVGALDGWGGAGTVGDLAQRSDSDGAFDSPFFYAPRDLTLSGSLYAESPQDLDDAWERLARAIPLTLSKMVVTDTRGRARWAMVKRAGAPDVTLLGGLCSFSFPLVAPDPHRYDAVGSSLVLFAPQPPSGLDWPLVWPVTWPAASTQLSSGAVSNDGDLATPVTVRFSGPVTNPALSFDSLGAQVGVDMAIDAGHFVDVDTWAGTVLYDGQVDYSAFLSRASSFPQLPPGVTAVSYLGSDGQVQISFASAWS